MTELSTDEVLTLLARYGFVAALFSFVLFVMSALRRSLRPQTASQDLSIARLVPLREGSNGQPLRIEGVALVGRNPESDILLREDSVSARHARIAFDGRIWTVDDLGSRNGTTVNGEVVAKSTRLSSGDILGFGAVHWRFETVSPVGVT